MPPTSNVQVIDLGFVPRPWQDDCFRMFKRFSVVVVHRRGGKTLMAIMRLIDAALRSTRERARYGYISPMLKQSKGIAWDYLKAYARKVPGTVINESDLSVEFLNGARIRLFGADNPDSLRGLYFDGIVLDEVAQMAAELWGEILVQTLAEREGFALFIGTPKGLNLFSTLYYKAVADAHWSTACYTCYQTDALAPDEIERIKHESTDAQFRQEMLCDFAASTENTLIPIDVAMAAASRHVPLEQYEFAPKVLGVDVAWQGGDQCAIFGRQGRVAFMPKVVPGLPEKAFTALVAQVIGRFQPVVTFVDTTGGYGGETLSRLRDDGHRVEGVVFSTKASDARFQNLRAEMWWRMSAWLAEGGAIPNRPSLLAELSTPTYSYDNAANRFTLESKDEIRARLGRSPDEADALALTFTRVLPIDGLAVGRRIESEFDPYRTLDAPVPHKDPSDWNPFA